MTDGEEIPAAALPLTGVRILDFSRFLPGPLAVTYLADLGADVIKVEAVPAGDVTRMMDPFVSFLVANRNKRSIAIDLADARARPILDRLVMRADVLLENARPGAMTHLGLDYDSVRAVRPDIIYCSLSAFGQTGPYKDIPAHGSNIDALAGMLELAFDADGTPRLDGASGYAGSLYTAQMTALAISGALFRRATSGAGCYLDSSCWDCALAGDPVTSAVAASGVAFDARFGSRATPKYAPYRTRDGRYLMVCVIENKFWRRFATLIGRDDLAGVFDRSDAPVSTWGEGYPHVYDEVARSIVDRDLAEWTALFTPSGLPVTPILTRAEALDSDHSRQRGFVSNGVDQQHRSFSMPGFGVLFDEVRPPVRGLAPEMDEHGAEILLELGFSRDEIADIRRERPRDPK